LTDRNIGFIGLGDMGKPMARRLLQGGCDVFSCAHRRREAIEELKSEGLVECDDPAAVGAKADILMSVVVDEAQTDRVLRGPSGAFATLRPGSVVVIMSTLAPKYCQDIAAEAASRDIAVLDCPISGGTFGAEQGTLALILGGDAEAVERCRPALETMGKIFHCGDVGLGQVAKLANNAVIIGTTALLWESRNLARSYGLAPDALMEVLANSTGNSFAVENWDRFLPMWPHLIDLVLKDMKLCRDAAEASGAAMPILQANLALDWEQTRDGSL